VLVGPGLNDANGTAVLVGELLRRAPRANFVLDAEAIVGLRDHRSLLASRSGSIIITPHAGEMAGLLRLARKDIEADALPVARRTAAELRCVVALKGARTYIATPDGEAWRRDGNMGLATSGSGDVLSGFIVGLLARGATPIAATLWGVSLHATAGEHLARARGPLGFLARELLEEAPRLLADLTDPPRQAIT
jgi:ADP-dependent NAD(P)H-hydrate dehydratase